MTPHMIQERSCHWQYVSIVSYHNIGEHYEPAFGTGCFEGLPLYCLSFAVRFPDPPLDFQEDFLGPFCPR